MSGSCEQSKPAVTREDSMVVSDLPDSTFLAESRFHGSTFASTRIKSQSESSDESMNSSNPYVRISSRACSILASRDRPTLD